MRLINFHRLLNSFLVLLLSFSIFSPLLNVSYADTTFPLGQMGKIISVSPMTLPSALASIATGVEVHYLSSDLNNNQVVVSGAIITPNVRPVHPNIVAWAHGSTGLADICAPSENLNVFWPEAVDAVQSYLQQGWVVAATDYQGLGVDQQGAPDDTHQYIVGNSEARAVIDSVRAARNIDNALTNKYVIVGHSQGGQASLFSGEIAGTYGGGLVLNGVVAIAPASHFEVLAQTVPGTPANGYVVAGLVGLASIDHTVNINNILTQAALNNLSIVTEAGCLEDFLGAYQHFTANRLLIGGQIPANIVTEFAQLGNPAQQPSTVPVLLVQGTADPLIPASLTADLQTKICSYGVSSFLQYIQGADHEGAVIQSTGFVSNYITNLFNGQSAPTNCN